MKNLIAFVFLCIAFQCFSQESSGPYLLVLEENGLIPLKKTSTDVQITGTIAHVQTTQVYHNLGNVPIEAEYVFPLSTGAAVHKMQMSIGDRTINAKIFERTEAQNIYRNALKNGKRAAKLDQDRPNVFKMAVGNILPGDEVTIDIYYTEMLAPINGYYRFVAPAVVGPRFTGESSANEESFNRPYTPKGISDSFKYDMTVSINAGMVIQNVSSTSHKVNVNYPNVTSAEVFLSKSNENPSNRDFILNYSLRGNEIQSGLLLYEHDDENFFAFQMEPTSKVRLEDIPSREYIFIVDVSGSMNGYPLEVSKELMRNLLCNLKPTDTFNVQLFASSSTVFSTTSVEATTENIEAATRFLSEGQGGGGTQLLSALKVAYELPRKEKSSARSMVVITDGYVSVEKEAFELIRSNLDRANVFTFGIGSSVNRYLIEGMAKVTNSESFIATSKAAALHIAEDFRAYIASPLLTQIKIGAEGFDAYDVYPRTVPDIFAARPITIYGKYRGKPNGTITIKGYQGKQKMIRKIKISSGNLSRKNKALRYLWARKKIEELDDYNKLFSDNTKDSVIALGLKYNLATNYTSFVAVDENSVNTDGTMKTVKQPLPMPQHVTNSAVGAEAGITRKTIYKKPFGIQLSEALSKPDKRRVTIQFRVLYSKIISELLEKHESIRVSFNEQGEVVKVEKRTKGQWKVSETLAAECARFSDKKLSLNQEITLVITK